MKATNSLAQQKEKKSFSAVIKGEGAQSLIRAALVNEKAVGRFTGTLINVVNSSKQLSECDPGSVISAALRGEGEGLIYGQGYYVVPYGKTANYMRSYKGWAQLAISTGFYADIDVIEVREGERKGRDPRTGKPIVDMSVYDTDEERERHKIIGIKAYFLLKDGYYREEYWTMGEILRHADRYSPAFSLDLYEKWQSGAELTKDEAYNVANGTPWYTSTMRMAKKTVLKSLLTSGFAPLSNEVKSMLDGEAESGEGDAIDFGDDIIHDYSVVETTGEVIDAQDAAEAAESDFEVAEPSDIPEPPKTRRSTKKEAPAEPYAEDDIASSFFGDDEL